MKKEKWSIGKTGGAVVTDNPKGFTFDTGHLDVDYYGGYLVCESIWRKKDCHLISAAPDLLEVLEDVVTDFMFNELPPLTRQRVVEAIKKAKGE